MDDYLFSWGKSLFKITQPLEYERFFKCRWFVPGVYIFSDLELLTEKERIQADDTWDALQNASRRNFLINHPTKCLRRYDLLKLLYKKNMNRFNIYRADEDLSAIQFSGVFA